MGKAKLFLSRSLYSRIRAVSANAVPVFRGTSHPIALIFHVKYEVPNKSGPLELF